MSYIENMRSIIRDNYWIVEHICFVVARIVVDPGTVYFTGRS